MKKKSIINQDSISIFDKWFEIDLDLNRFLFLNFEKPNENMKRKEKTLFFLCYIFVLLTIIGIFTCKMTAVTLEWNSNDLLLIQPEKKFEISNFIISRKLLSYLKMAMKTNLNSLFFIMQLNFSFFT